MVPFFLVGLMLLAGCAAAATPAAKPAAANSLPNTGFSRPGAVATVPAFGSDGNPTATAAATAAPTEGPMASPTEAASPMETAAAVPTVQMTVTDVEGGVTLDNVQQASYNGACQVALTFKANISTNGAGNVTYTWLRSDGTSSPVRTLTFTGAGYQSVTDAWVATSPDGIVSASDRVFIDQPNHQAFSGTSFNLTCNPVLPTPRPKRGKP